MYTVRMLPIGAPLAAIIPLTGHGLAVVLSILGILLMLPVVRWISRMIGPTEGPQA